MTPRAYPIPSDIKVPCHDCGDEAILRIEDGTTIGIRLCAVHGVRLFDDLGDILKDWVKNLPEGESNDNPSS